MKKFTILLIGLLTSMYAAYAGNPIDSVTASTVARNFYNHSTGSNLPSINLVHTEKVPNGDTVVYYIYNMPSNKGWVIVTADDAAQPILGYSTSGQYENKNVSPEFSFWMDGYKNQILWLKRNSINTSNEISQQWQSYASNQFQNSPQAIMAVAPLLTTTWGQGQFYNANCPGGSVTGCGATAMAKIMKYWNYPTQGTGSHSYYHSVYGTLSANFGTTTYNWASMPNSLSSPNNAVATLMSHCGIAVEMDYSPASSGSWVLTNDNFGYHSASAQNAYTTYFNFSNNIQGVRKINYINTSWVNLLVGELNNARPIQYAGWDATWGGHTWVCDGVDNNSLFHMNWGWNGSDNGYFAVTSLNPQTFFFDNHQQALIGIQPGGSNCTPPSNDMCAGAIQLSDNSSCISTTGTVDCATSDGFPTIPTCNGTSQTQKGVFYYFIAQSNNANITVTPTNTSATGLDVVLQVLSGANCNSLYEITGGCIDDFSEGQPETLTLNNLVLGQRYTVRIYDFGAIQPPIGNGGFNICVTHTNTGSSPIANFSGSPVSGVSPLSVNFSDLSSNAPTSWSWDFGDGTTSTQQNPVHVYGSAGVYSVSLSVTNSFGANSLSRSSFISVTPGGSSPITAFIGTPVTGTSPLSVTFYDQSSNTPTSWYWEFGDGQNSYQQNPIHLYSNPGIYTVSLTCSNAFGTNVKVNSNYILVNATGSIPIADFSGSPTSGPGPLTVSFNDISANNPTSWQWNFGDGQNSNQQNPTHIYSTSGTYSVTLNATNSFGTHSISKSGFVTVNNNNQPQCSFTISNTSPCVGQTILLDNTSIGGPFSSFTWQFNPWNVNFISGNQNSEHVQIQFTSPGSYQVYCQVLNNFGISDLTMTVNVSNCGTAPVSNFSGTPVNGISPLTVNFTDLSSNSPTNWWWDFGDGNTSSDQNPFHVFTTPGLYSVSLTSGNSYGSDAITKNNFILVSPPNTGCTFGINPLSANFGENGGSGTFYVNGITGNCSWIATTPDSIYIHFLTNGGSTYGSNNVDFIVDPCTGVDRTLQINVAGQTYLISQQCAHGQAPVSNFTSSNTTPIAGEIVNLVDQSSNSPTSWNWSITPSTGWNFTNGTNSNSQNPDLVFSGQGYYSISLNTQNQYGYDVELKINFITVIGGNQTVSLISPSNGNNTGSATNILLDWSDIINSSYYSVEVSLDYNFSSILWARTFSGSSETYFAPPIPITTYYWRVRANISGTPGQWSSTWNFTTNLSTTGISEGSSEDALSIYPNPSKGEINIDGLESILEIYVYDAKGIQIAYLLNEKKEHKLSIDLTEHSSGIYVIRLVGKNSVVLKQIIKD